MSPSAIIFVNIIISCSIWCTCLGDPFINLWSQTCKIHADTKHEEFKGILEQKDKFNTNNWSHTSSLAILVLLSSLAIILGCCCAVKYGRIILFAFRLRNNQKRGIPTSLDQQPTYLPYNTQMALMGRPVQFAPNPKWRETEGILEV